MKPAIFYILSILFGVSPALCQAAKPDGTLEIKALDAQSKQPVAVRMQLRRGGGRPLKNRGLGVARHGDHFYIDGRADLELRRGQYRFDLDAGPEYKPVGGHFEIERRASDSKTVEMHRVVRLDEEGWFGADLLAKRGSKDLGVALRAESLAYCPLTAWSNEKGDWKPLPTATSADGATHQFGPHAAQHRSTGGRLLFCRVDGPLTKDDLGVVGDASVENLQAAGKQGLRIVASDATSWRLPVWLAAGVLDGVVVIDSSDTVPTKRRAKPIGRQPDKTYFPGMAGKAQWREAIYFHILNAGLRLPPLAGSGTGDNDLPLGAARVYAQAASPFSAEEWWDSVELGEVFVTNGPLVRPIPAPGAVYHLSQEDAKVAPALNLTTRKKIEYLEVVKNGEVEHTVALRDLVKARGQMPEIDCTGSGWFLLRAIATNAEGYQRGMTGPYYFVPKDGKARISRASCEFFLEWLKEAKGVLDPAELALAQEFWQQRLGKATAP